jgi:hypothetical protein
MRRRKPSRFFWFMIGAYVGKRFVRFAYNVIYDADQMDNFMMLRDRCETAAEARMKKFFDKAEGFLDGIIN